MLFCYFYAIITLGDFFMLNRSELREKIMTILYQINLFKDSKVSYNIDEIIKENVDIENEFVKDIVYGVTTYYDELCELANKYLVDWTIDRLDSTGRTILLMGLYELKYTETPDIVVINEALDLANKYSTENVRKMINAVLDKVRE